MVRVSNGLARHKRHRKFVKEAKWFRLWRNNVYKQVRLALVKQWQHAYEWRKHKKRDFRRLWIERLSAVLRSKGTKYSIFINKMDNRSVVVNRKILSNIAIVFPNVFDKIYDAVMTEWKISQSVAVANVKEKKVATKKVESDVEATEVVDDKKTTKAAPKKPAATKKATPKKDKE